MFFVLYGCHLEEEDGIFSGLYYPIDPAYGWFDTGVAGAHSFINRQVEQEESFSG